MNLPNDIMYNASFNKDASFEGVFWMDKVFSFDKNLNIKISFDLHNWGFIFRNLKHFSKLGKFLMRKKFIKIFLFLLS